MHRQETTHKLKTKSRLPGNRRVADSEEMVADSEEMASDTEEMVFFVRKWPPTRKKWTFSDGNEQNPGRNGFLHTRTGKISEEIAADSEEMNFSVQRMTFSVLKWLSIRKK